MFIQSDNNPLYYTLSFGYIQSSLSRNELVGSQGFPQKGRH